MEMLVVVVVNADDILHRCWDGKNLDSPNHSDHVAHPIGGPVAFPVVNGTCPASHPVKVPQVMFEVSRYPHWHLRFHLERGEMAEKADIGDVGHDLLQRRRRLARGWVAAAVSIDRR